MRVSASTTAPRPIPERVRRLSARHGTDIAIDGETALVCLSPLARAEGVGEGRG